MNEKNFEQLNTPEEPERELSPEEKEELGEEMDEYLQGILERIAEIEEELKIRADDERVKELKAELEELKEQAGGLGEFIEEIPDAESITEKPVDESDS